MRIHRVDIAGFGPYKVRQSVDFETYADDGIYLITGRTGAGKSTILDAICFALYGSVPRYDGSNAKTTALRSDYAELDEKSLVELEFTAGGIRYRIERSPEYERRKSRGDGTTVQAMEVRLFRQEAGGWVGLGDRGVDVAALLHDIVQLSKEQFLQVVLLAQNRFQEFLRAKSEERQALLRTLFGSARFEHYDEWLQTRRKSLEERLAGAQGDIERLGAQLSKLEERSGLLRSSPEDGTPLDRMEGLLSAFEQAAADAAARAAETEASSQRARASHETHVALRARQDRLATRRAALVALTEAAAGHEEEIAAALATAEAHLDLGEERSLEHAASLLAELTGSLGPAVASERSIAGLEAAKTNAEALLRRRDEALVKLREDAGGWKHALDALAPRIAQQRDAAADEAAAAQLVDRIAPAIEALTAAARLEGELEELRRHELDAGRRRTSASGVLDELRQRRLDGHAAELATTLVDGEPCPVCGALAHPAPAPVSDEPVTEEAIAEAEQELRTASAAAEKGSEARSAAEGRLDGLRKAAPDRTLAELLGERVEATARVAAARTAATQLAALLAEQEALQQKIDGQATAEDELHELRESATAGLATTAKALDDALVAAAAARGAFGSVAARAGAVDTALATVRALMARLREHTAALDAARAALEDPELRDLPAEPVELDETQTALGEAQRARDAARDESTRLASALTAAAGHLLEARAASAASGALQSEYETVRRLAETVHGGGPNTLRMTLESFVLAAELEAIVDAANAQLGTMTGGRYQLEHSDRLAARGAKSGLGLSILDAHTGDSRSTQSLSGGETFLASLALALGLAEVVTSRAGGITLDTLFIDEGFGSLDSETLEIAMGTLDALRTGGRTIGLISHVEAMKEQIPAKLRVEVADGGWSVISQG